MKLVMIESPYRNGLRNKNLRYLAWCEYHSASLGEAPISSHGNCTAYWPETNEYRTLGFQWRDTVRKMCELVCYYVDLGMSEGAVLAEERDKSENVKSERRNLPEDMFKSFEAGYYPPGSMVRVNVTPRILEAITEDNYWLAPGHPGII